MQPLLVDPYNPASAPNQHALIARARAALVDLLARRPSLSPLTEAEKAEALAFARAHLENDRAALLHNYWAVNEVAERERLFLNSSDLPAAARHFLHAHIQATGARRP